MSHATALVRARDLADDLQYCKVRSSIELEQGRTVGSLDRWDSNLWRAQMHHHTAGPKSGITPSLGVCKHGRGKPGQVNYLPGPLCNGYGGRDHIYRIICMGPANHPGLGGPITLAGVTIPHNNGRPYIWGTEWEHDGVSRWDDDMLEFMARGAVAIARWRKMSLQRMMEHKTWAGPRKSDRNQYTRQEFLDMALHYAAVIEKEHNPVVKKPVTFTIRRGLEQGDKGKDVIALQKRLNQYILNHKIPGVTKKLVQDGDFGPATAKAVLAFKRSKGFKGMDRNAKVGGGTIRTLGGFLRYDAK